MPGSQSQPRAAVPVSTADWEGLEIEYLPSHESVAVWCWSNRDSKFSGFFQDILEWCILHQIRWIKFIIMNLSIPGCTPLSV